VGIVLPHTELPVLIAARTNNKNDVNDLNYLTIEENKIAARK
jgi:hypothetical protein